MISNIENRPGSVEGAGFEVSMLGGADTSESTSTARPTQAMPSPRAYSDATGGTSQAAARAARAVSSKTCQAILDYLNRSGASSCEEIVDGLKLEGVSLLLNTARARVCDMHKAGLLADSGGRGIGESGKCRVVRWSVV